MALGTYVDVVRLIATCGTGVEAVTTAASDVHFFVFGMYFWLHVEPLTVAAVKRARILLCPP